MWCNNIVTWEPWISHQFCVLAGRDGQGSTSGLGNSHDVVGQSPGEQNIDEDNDQGEENRDDGKYQDLIYLSFRSFTISSLFMVGSQPVMSRSTNPLESCFMDMVCLGFWLFGFSSWTMGCDWWFSGLPLKYKRNNLLTFTAFSSASQWWVMLNAMTKRLKDSQQVSRL